MAKIDTDKLSPQERKKLLEMLAEDEKKYKEENLLEVKAEFEALAKERGFTLGQIFLAGVKRPTGPRGPRKKKTEAPAE